MQPPAVAAPPQPATMFRKIWDAHTVAVDDDGSALIYIDRHYLQDGSLSKFTMIEDRGLTVRRPDLTFAVHDHYAPTLGGRLADVADPNARAMLEGLTAAARRYGIEIFPLGDRRQGIIHVVGPELGITLPGTTVVSSDSHTTTHGGLGAFAIGAGASECAGVLATQCLWVARPKTMRITVDGALSAGVTAKDMSLAILARVGAGGAVGHAVEFAGSAVAGLGVSGRLTLCNMAVECGARTGMVAPDDAIYTYLEGRPYAPAGAAFDRAVARWRTLPSDDGAVFDREVALNAGDIGPMVTWGISPQHALPVAGRVPDPAEARDAAEAEAWSRALAYMDLAPGTPLEGLKIDRVFIGSCTNARIEDLREAAAVVKGRKARVEAWVVPGSTAVGEQAEAEGLDRVFTDAGMQWRRSSCSMCVAQNGDRAASGERCVSTTNRNFIGRQGSGVRTHLASPALAAAAAVTGTITDVRRLLTEGER
ncbi:3-isopropylmalate dehydratase large subunit [Acuticoccus sediminis]|uniref:3-isopropylmalate dehydratase n=1 Tax=Acuticoccus sediminis TaxID=2184697 RepID=A0A8B2NZ77_9HYPH|nr:3-isopropylmalate dehydratase large subunit [Acuticoccus sediminis]RAI01860.1 3-isopropylmalate dehydratase large subunit [Acuticoccus sediminis]